MTWLPWAVLGLVGGLLVLLVVSALVMGDQEDKRPERDRPEGTR